MALRLDTLAANIGRLLPVSASWPFGELKPDSTGTTRDGTPLNKDNLDDIFAFFQWLLVTAGMTPNGVRDNALNSQYGNALIAATVGTDPRVSRTTYITASTPNWEPDPLTREMEVTVIGGGGGGGGVDGRGPGTAAASGSGAAGATAIRYITNLQSSYTIFVGAGGAGGSSAGGGGGDGGTSTFEGSSTNVDIRATGGLRGDGIVGIAGITNRGGQRGGISTGGDLNVNGEGATTARVRGGGVVAPSVAGAGPFGGRGATTTGAVSSSQPAQGPGSGGGGGFTEDNDINFTGGAGADGLVIIKEFF